MRRTLTVVGAAVIALTGAVAESQAQSPQRAPATGEQRGGRPEFDCGPGRGTGDRGAGVQPGRNGGRPPQGALQGRGPGGGRRGGLGRPGAQGRVGGRGGPLCGLDLTEDQKAQIATIHEKSRAEVAAVLTPEQREKLRARRGGR